MAEGRKRYMHAAQAVKPASRPSVKPWSPAAMPDQRPARKPRERKPARTFSPEVAAVLAAYERSRAAHAARAA
jgi:hypothetical protein